MNTRQSVARLVVVVTIAVSIAGGCRFHSRAWQPDRGTETPSASATTHADTQPIVRQSGEPMGPATGQKESKAARAARTLAAANDGRAAAMFLLTNDVELSFARMGYANASSDEVKAFARRMLTDHTQMMVSARSLISAQDLNPSDDNAASDLRDASTLQRDSLRALSGRAFDSAYVEMELQRHREILSIIDDVLLPRARGAQLRDFIASMRPIISAHIAHAQQLRATLATR